MADEQQKQATNVEAGRLPPLYKSLVPLSANFHGDLSFTPAGDFRFAAGLGVVPLTAEEFPVAQRYFPILFARDAAFTPLALLGVNDGENLFVDAQGNWAEGVYVPAYIRRYPFMLVRPSPDAERLTLCFDDQAEGFGRGGERKLFDGNQASQLGQDILKFCEQFDQAGVRTQALSARINEMKLFQEGNAVIQPFDQPITFTGFTSVSEDAIRKLSKDQLGELASSGALAIIYAHLCSMGALRELMYRAGRRNPQPAA